MDAASQILDVGDYGSEFEYDSEAEKKRRKREDLAKPEAHTKVKLPEKNTVTEEYSKEVNRHERFHLLTLDAFSRHKKIINDYLLYYGGSRKEFVRDVSKDRTDYDVLRDNHKFLWDDDDDNLQNSWEKRLAKKYYDKLFKEYCIGDLSRYKENKIALRWRTEVEVVSGKGQFTCGEKRCLSQDQLRSWEVNFAYVEQNQKRNALVKIRLCPECSHKLNYRHRKREIKKRKSENQLESENKKKSKAEVLSEETTTTEASNTEKTKEESEVSETSKSAACSTDEETRIWSKATPVVEEKPREDEFEEYFEDMLL